MVVELGELAKCLRIWEMKEWLADPSKHNPLTCENYYNRTVLNITHYSWKNCRCHNIIEALWCDDTFRRIFSEARIDRNNNQPSSWRRIHRQLIDYAKKLYSGEEMVSNSNRALNVLTSSQAKRLANSVTTAIKCKERVDAQRPGHRLYW